MSQAAVPPSSATEAPASYEAALAELERIVDELESGSMPLQDMLSSYQRGAALLQYCREQLKAVDEQVRLIDGTVFKPKRST
jgi:exodeoxyribonuclease VII small subunit